jgi:hypothetical protein
LSKLIKVAKGGKEIQVTEKAFRVVYESWGYKPVKESAKAEKKKDKK